TLALFRSPAVIKSKTNGEGGCGQEKCPGVEKEGRAPRRAGSKAEGGHRQAARSSQNNAAERGQPCDYRSSRSGFCVSWFYGHRSFLPSWRALFADSHHRAAGSLSEFRLKHYISRPNTYNWRLDYVNIAYLLILSTLYGWFARRAQRILNFGGGYEIHYISSTVVISKVITDLEAD